MESDNGTDEWDSGLPDTARGKNGQILSEHFETEMIGSVAGYIATDGEVLPLFSLASRIQCSASGIEQSAVRVNHLCRWPPANFFHALPEDSDSSLFLNIVTLTGSPLCAICARQSISPVKYCVALRF